MLVLKHDAHDKREFVLKAFYIVALDLLNDTIHYVQISYLHRRLYLCRLKSYANLDLHFK